MKKVKNMLINCNKFGQNNGLKFLKKNTCTSQQKVEWFSEFCNGQWKKANYCFYSILTNIIFECT